MLLLSAVVLLLGFSLNLGFNVNKTPLSKMLLIMSLANIISISIYLVNMKGGISSEQRMVHVFFDTTILLLNLIIARYVYMAKISDDSKLEKLIVNLFGVTFISDCILIFLIYFFKHENNIFEIDNNGFFWIYIPLSILMIWGTIIPSIRLIRFIKNKQSGFIQLTILLLLNMLNNVVGFYFYIIQFPSKETGTILNMISNLGFAYYFGYFLLSEYFKSKKKTSNLNKEDVKVIYTWTIFKTHIGSWNEARSYLLQYLPELVTDIEQYQLSDLEKIHLCLKKLKITSKEVADIMNISTRSVETQRYRINKKIESGITLSL
jgi:DNA-binding CsgD family transcriptional regulator